MYLHRQIVLFVLICIVPVGVLPPLVSIERHLDDSYREQALTLTEALHRKINNADAPVPNVIAKPADLDRLHRIPTEVGIVKSFWPRQVFINLGLLRSTVFIKGSVVFAHGVGNAELRWRFACWRKPMLEHYEVKCFPGDAPPGAHYH